MTDITEKLSMGLSLSPIQLDHWAVPEMLKFGEGICDSMVVVRTTHLKEVLCAHVED